jgi:hypothetical protein
MEITTVSISEIAEQPSHRWDAEYWVKKKALQLGTKVIIAANSEGNMCEPFVGMEGVIVPKVKNKRMRDWYGVRLTTESVYGWRFNFHIDELEIID